MPTVSKESLSDIRAAGIPVHQTLYSLENQLKAVLCKIPEAYRPAVTACMTEHHQALKNLQVTTLGCLDIDPLTDDEVIALGGPGGGK